MLSMLSVLSAMAGSRTLRQMKAIAQAKLEHVAATRAEGNGLRLEKLYENDALALVGDTTAGFVIIARDDIHTPVVGVSQSPFSISSMPDAFRWWLGSMTERLMSGDPLLTRSVQEVPNFMDIHWDQREPYNGLCPLDGVTRCPTGCVATAMAQIMKYYQYPAQGAGSGYYTVGSLTRKHRVTINSTYDWANMRKSYGRTSGANQVKAVQQLMYDAGVAVQMNYGKDGSSAALYMAARAFIDNFSYDSLAVRYYFSDYVGDEEWMDIIYKELSLKRPVLYGAEDSNMENGHAFLLTGCNTDGQVYVNWGWGLVDSSSGEGGYDGYFDISGLVLSKIHFTDGHEMVLGLRPQKTPDEQDELTSSWAIDGECIMQAKSIDSVAVSMSSYFNMHPLTFHGKLMIRFTNVSTSHTEFVTFADCRRDPVPFMYGYVPDDDEEEMTHVIGTGSLPAGTYEVCPVSQDYHETVPKVFHQTGGVPSFTMVKAADGTLRFLDSGSTTIYSLPADAAEADAAWYSLDGRRLFGRPAAKGLYIHHGKKSVVK